MTKGRVPDYPVLPLILNRWSSRAMAGGALSEERLLKLFDAARWAPSSYNNQPWRFIYAHQNTESFQRLFDLLVPFNQRWAAKASVLVVIISSDMFAYNGKPSRTHSFDTGAAWQNLCLQGSADGLVVHGMEGFDYEKARTDLDIPAEYTIEAMCAIGLPGDVRLLPLDLQEREELSGRNPLESFVFEGKFYKKTT